MLQAIKQQTAIHQTGEVVKIGNFHQFTFGVFLFGDIGNYHQIVSVISALFAGHAINVYKHIILASVGRLNALLAFPNSIVV